MKTYSIELIAIDTTDYFYMDWQLETMIRESHAASIIKKHFDSKMLVLGGDEHFRDGKGIPRLVRKSIRNDAIITQFPSYAMMQLCQEKGIKNAILKSERIADYVLVGDITKGRIQ